MTAMAEPVTAVLPLHMDEDGVIRVGGTRVTLDVVLGEWQQGATPEQILQDFTSLALRDIYAAITYYLDHLDEVDGYLAERRRQAAEVRRQNEARFPRNGIRERLLARLAAQRYQGVPDARVQWR